MKFSSGFKKAATCGISGVLALSVGVVGFGPNIADAASVAWDTWNNNVPTTQANQTDPTGWNSDWETYKANWDTTKANWENVSMAPGATASELNFAWLSKTEETPQVRIATSEAALSSAEAISGQQISCKDDLAKNYTSNTVGTALDNYYANKVTVKGLKENTQYYYQVFQDGEWKNVQKYKTGDTSNFSFLYVGDPQIGASSSKGADMTKSEADTGSSTAPSATAANYSARNDAYNWDKALDQAVSANPNVSFMISAGDQVNYGNNEVEFAGFLSASALSSLPVATTIGNHETYGSSPLYSYHFNTPNTQTSAETTEGKTTAGTDYYYRYGDALFIVLDTNNYNCKTHENVIKKAIAANKDAKWRIVTFHQDIYGSGYDHSDSDGIVLRTQLTKIIDDNDIDVVLQGHDHTYSRSYAINSDGETHNAYSTYYTTSSGKNLGYSFMQDNNCYLFDSNTGTGTITNPKGTVYLEANSASGSKYYNLIPTKQDYIAERSQTWTPTYSVVQMTKDSFTVKTYDATTGKEVAGSSSLTIKKTDTTPAKKATTSVTVNTKTVSAASLKAAAKKAGATTTSLTKVTLGSKVTTIKSGAFKAYKNVKTVIAKTKKLTKKSIKGAFKSSKVTTVKVNVGKASADKKQAKAYKKIMTKAVVGKKVTVKAA